MIKKREEKKELKEKLMDFFNSLTEVDNFLKSRSNILTLLYHMDKDIVSRKLELIFDIKYSPQTKTENNQTLIYISECIEYADIRLEDEEWVLFVGFFHFILGNKRNRSKKIKIQTRESLNESEREILIDFLKHLEERFKKANIIKHSKELVDEALIKKIKG